MKRTRKEFKETINFDSWFSEPTLSLIDHIEKIDDAYVLNIFLKEDKIDKKYLSLFTSIINYLRAKNYQYFYDKNVLQVNY